MRGKVENPVLGISAKDISASYFRSEDRNFLVPRFDVLEITPHEALALKVREGMREKGMAVGDLADQLDLPRDDVIDICMGTFPLGELPVEIDKLEEVLAFEENELYGVLAEFYPTQAEELGKKARQVAIRLHDSSIMINPLDELIQEGENFHSIDEVPVDFEKMGREVAGNNADVLFKLFTKVTSKTREIEGASIGKPFIYDKRDSNSSKVRGVKIGRRGGLSRLATLELSLPVDEPAITLSVQNSRFPYSTPDLVFKANKEEITLARTTQQVEQDEKWLDELFDEYVEQVLAEAQAIYPELT